MREAVREITLSAAPIGELFLFSFSFLSSVFASRRTSCLFSGILPTFLSFGRIRQSGILSGFISLFCVGVVSEDSGRLGTRVTALLDLFDFFISFPLVTRLGGLCGFGGFLVQFSGSFSALV